METKSNSTKQAAAAAHSFLMRNQSSMTDEDIHAIRVLIAAADQNPDQHPKIWHCDTYCRKVRHVSCEGRLSAEEGADVQCPYLDEMLY